MTDSVDIVIAPQEIDLSVSPIQVTVTPSQTTQSVTVEQSTIALDVTPVQVNVEVADPDKVGEAGATIVSVTTEDDELIMLMSDGRELTAPVSLPIQKETEIDFGQHALAEKVFTIVDAGVTTESLISVFHSGKAATGKDQDENEMDKLLFCAVAGNGGFTLYAQCFPNVVEGKFKINYLVG